MASEAPQSRQARRETGAQIHRRESRRQVILPFGLGILLVIGSVVLVAVPGAVDWRVRAQAVADWTYTTLCLVPLALCLFPVFVLLAPAIYYMNRLHRRTERPLRKLEDLAGQLTAVIESATVRVRETTGEASDAIAPVMNAMSIFDVPEEEEAGSGEPATE